MARGDFPSAKQDQYMLRFPNGMRDRLKEEAAKNNRSMNAEILSRLEASLRKPEDDADDISGPPLTPALFDKMFENLKRIEAKIDRAPDLKGNKSDDK